MSCAGSEEVRTPRCTLIMKGLSLPPLHPPPLHPTPPHRTATLQHPPPSSPPSGTHTVPRARTHARPIAMAMALAQRCHREGVVGVGEGSVGGVGAGAGNIAALSSLPLAKLITHSYTSPPCRGLFRRGYRLIKNTQRYTAAAQISIYFPTWIVTE